MMVNCAQQEMRILNVSLYLNSLPQSPLLIVAAWLASKKFSVLPFLAKILSLPLHSQLFCFLQADSRSCMCRASKHLSFSKSVTTHCPTLSITGDTKGPPLGDRRGTKTVNNYTFNIFISVRVNIFLKCMNMILWIFLIWRQCLEPSHWHILQWQIHSSKYTICCREHWQHDRIITLLLFVVYKLL